MNSLDSKIPILIFGATGKLGVPVTKHALSDPKFQVNILVRDPSKNAELVSQIEVAGGKVIKGDLGNPESVTNVTQGMHTVVSLTHGYDSKINIDGQIALVEDCIKNGVKRFMPSDFGSNFTKFSKEELLKSSVAEYKLKMNDYLETVSLPLLRFNVGLIIDTIFTVFAYSPVYWGENFKHDFTCYENIAQLVVSALLNLT